MHYYSSADEPSLGPPLIFRAPHFNFMELKWGAQKKSGGPKKIRRKCPPPTFNLLPTPLLWIYVALVAASAVSYNVVNIIGKQHIEEGRTEKKLSDGTSKFESKSQSMSESITPKST